MNQNDATHQITHLNGVAIIAREPALGPHPRHPDRQVAFAGATKVLLEDGTEHTICDDCGREGENTRSVVSHRNSTHNRAEPAKPIYPDEVLRRLIREVNKAKAGGVRYSAEAVAEALNRAGLTTTRGEAWTASNVSHIYNVYKDKIRVRASTAGRGGPEQQNGHRPAPPTVAQDLRDLGKILDDAGRLVTQIAYKMADLQKVVDPAIADKAAKWDRFQEMMKDS